MTGSSKFSKIVAGVIAAIVAVGGFTLAVTDNGPDRRSTVTITVGAHRPGDDGAKIVAPVAQVQAAEKSEVAGHEGARDESPPGVSSADLERSIERQDELAHSDQLPIVSPDAAPSVAGCRSQFVQNFSSRRGVAPRQFWVHYTVSRNVAGWGDVNAITALFDRAAFAASSTFVYDAEGNCAYIVRESDKPWTQAGLNPYAISAEIIAFGDESSLLKGAALAKFGRLIRGSAVRWKFPLTRGSVVGCVPGRPGIVMHADGGVCAGGHHDILPFPLEPIIRAAQAAQDPVCGRVHAYRGRPVHTSEGTAAFRARLAQTRDLGLRCVDGRARPL